MTSHPVHRFVKLQNGGDEFNGPRWLDLVGPMLLHPLEDVDKPLTSDIVADKE